jgi:hypothetical protein
MWNFVLTEMVPVILTTTIKVRKIINISLVRVQKLARKERDVDLTNTKIQEKADSYLIIKILHFTIN